MSSNSEPSTPESTPNESSSLPKLSSEGRAEAKRIIDEFDANLKGISAHIASDAGASKIIEPDIRQAHSTLRECALTIRKPLAFYQRADFKVGVGSILIGLAPTVASVAKDVMESGGGKIGDQPIALWTCMIGLPFIIFGGRVFLTAWGWAESPNSGKL